MEKESQLPFQPGKKLDEIKEHYPGNDFIGGLQIAGFLAAELKRTRRGKTGGKFDAVLDNAYRTMGSFERGRPGAYPAKAVEAATALLAQTWERNDDFHAWLGSRLTNEDLEDLFGK